MFKLKETWAKLSSNSFILDVGKLSLGTLGGRLIALAALPFITRLYSPDHFAMLAVYLALVSTIAVAASFRLEIAIPLADNDTEAAALLYLSLISTGAISAVVLFFTLYAPQLLANVLGKPSIQPYLWLVAIGVAMAATYSIFQYWATRKRRFGSIAQTRISQAFAAVVTMLGLGLIGFAPVGLLLGNVLNMGSGGLQLAREALRRDKTDLLHVSWANLKTTLHSHKRYPIYATPEALAGFLLLAMQVMAAPMALLGTSIAQVYMSRAPDEMRGGNLAPFTLGIMQRLVKIGVGPLMFAGIVAPVIFPIVFGKEWQRSGEIVAWLTPWMALQFVSSPVSAAMYVAGKQRAMLALTILGFIARVGAVLFALKYFPNNLVEIFVLGCITYYLLVALWTTRAAGFTAVHYRGFAVSWLNWQIVASVVMGLATVGAAKIITL
jgi:O-antigen/teichoic acid export membrane protein